VNAIQHWHLVRVCTVKYLTGLRTAMYLQRAKQQRNTMLLHSKFFTVIVQH
jgi:hypothetical protein